jgi:hypothetical protein
MNERIEELEKQCWVKVPCDFDMSAGGLSTIRTVFDRKKFAELIVEECAYIVENSPWRLKRGYKAIDQANLVKKHFGVEE